MTRDFSKHHRSLPSHTCLNRKCRMGTWIHPIFPGCQSSAKLLRDSRETKSAQPSGARVAHQSNKSKMKELSLWSLMVMLSQVLNWRKRQLPLFHFPPWKAHCSESAGSAQTWGSLSMEEAPTKAPALRPGEGVEWRLGEKCWVLSQSGERCPQGFPFPQPPQAA